MEYTRKNGEHFFSVVFNGGLRGSQRDCIKILFQLLLSLQVNF